MVCLWALWEVFEYTIRAIAKRLGVEPILVSYGRADVAFDLGFDLFGAVLVLVFGDRLLATEQNGTH